MTVNQPCAWELRNLILSYFVVGYSSVCLGKSCIEHSASHWAESEASRSCHRLAHIISVGSGRCRLCHRLAHTISVCSRRCCHIKRFFREPVSSTVAGWCCGGDRVLQCKNYHLRSDEQDVPRGRSAYYTSVRTAQVQIASIQVQLTW